MSGGHDKAGGKTIGESRLRSGGWTCQRWTYQGCMVRGPRSSPKWVPALQIAQVPLPFHPETLWLYWAAYSWAAQGADRVQGKCLWTGTTKKSLRPFQHWE